MNRNFRLTRSTDFKRVRRCGKSYAHPLLVLVALPNHGLRTRFAVSASRTVGGAVQRNRAKRMLREALRPLLPQIQPGWDVILLSRAPIVQAPLAKVQEGLQSCLRRANLIKPPYEH